MLSLKRLSFGLAAASAAAGRAFAQDAAHDIAPATEAAASNGLLLLIAGLLVMVMAAGFAMRQAGLVRAKSAAAIALQSFAAYALAGMTTWLVGYNLLFGVEPGGLLGGFETWAPSAAADEPGAAVWFFRMGAAALTAMIVSGALAERLRLWPFLIFAALLTGLIYPIEASWVWGKGFLDATLSFKDFAGATLIHAAGGWAGLAGALVLGPRLGRYEGGRVNPAPGASPPRAVLGTFLLWLGWFGLNGGAALAPGEIGDAGGLAKIFVNTNMAAAAGVVAAMAVTQIVYKKVDLAVVLGAAVGGLVSIAAEPLAPAIWQAVVIGAFGGVIVTLAGPVLDRLKIDDAAGAIPAHLLCGIWGTLIVPWSNHQASWLGQIAGTATIGAFVFTMSTLAWMTLKYTLGIRVSAEHEQKGLDRAELGLETYPANPRG